MTDSKAEDRRAVFVQCLDDEGKMELDRVFDEEYDRFYSKFEWLPINEKDSVPERESLKKRIEKFCWIEEWFENIFIDFWIDWKWIGQNEEQSV